jgi:Mg-chelatase subunit ChlD
MKWLCVLVFFPLLSFSQLKIEKIIDLGEIAAAYEIKGDVIVTNSSSKKIYLLRADAGRDVKVYASKKTLPANDTCLLIISFIPQNSGRFSETIKLVSSDQGDPYIITLKGNLQNLKRDDKLACFYFGNRRSSPVAVKETPIIVPSSPEKRPTDNRIPDHSSSTPPPPPAPPAPIVTPEVTKTNTLTPASKQDHFSIEEYKPNNIIFLVDVSGSMRDSTKLPLMKKSLLYLVKQIRTEDRLTFITYADTVKILSEAASATDRQILNQTIDGLKAKGMTKGRKAIFIAQQLAQKHYLPEGNNEIIIATDGKFRFEKEDEKLFKERQGQKPVNLSTVAFGDEKEALKNLKDIAKRGNGSFVQVLPGENSTAKIFEDIRKRTKRSDNR